MEVQRKNKQHVADYLMVCLLLEVSTLPSLLVISLVKMKVRVFQIAMVMQIYQWELLTIYHHPGKFGDPRHGDCGDIMNLTCHLISRDHMFKGLCEFMGVSLSW